ncbi:MAG: cytochrome c biogenesis protein CcsA, partial [Bacteroidota bacterium]
YYEYHYAWSHSSNNLPTHFMVSCFWEGQEGSFLLWMFWHVILGTIFIFRKDRWEAPVMTVFAAVQAFLTSMILGVVIPGLEYKIGSSPFLLLRDVLEVPVFQLNPDYIPEDGTGLNPLLQNYWMVIHPPMLFLGFALTLLPFAYCVAGLWQKATDWVKPALPWALMAAAVLGVGIMMGGYWAYETLNFEGYWNWDPVENAVYVPWLVLVASVHLMVVERRRRSAIRPTIILTLSSFLLILYSTFLTRSGILGNASVHSFTDLGLSEQLLFYLLFFVLGSVALCIRAWKTLPKSEKEATVYSGEFWIFLGATVLGLMAFQVIIPTSIPVFNAIAGLFGIESNIAPPGDQVEFYTNIQIWFALALALLSGTAQLFWWKRIENRKQLQDTLFKPVFATMVLSGFAITAFGMSEWKLILLLVASIYTLASNGFVIVTLAKKKVSLSGGAITHMGVGLMLIGILASSGYTKIISLNNSGYVYSRELPDEINKENKLLWRNTPEQMENYTIVWRGVYFESPEFPTYISREDLEKTSVPYHMMAKADLVHEGEVIFKKGDLVQVYDENSYFKIDYTDKEGKTFSLYPRLQRNETMGTVVSPAIRKRWRGDIYTHLTSSSELAEEEDWSNPERMELGIGDTFVVNDYIAILKDIVVDQSAEGVDFSLEAKVDLLDRDATYEATPIYQIKDNFARKIPDVVEAMGVKISLDKINPETSTFDFTTQTRRKDWITLKAIEKPLIDLLWIGTIIMALGMFMAMFRRFKK